MKIKPSSSAKENQVFSQALAKVVSASRASVQKAIVESKSEKTSKHKRWKFDPEGDRERS
jgi:hypothetical protein